MDYNIDEEVWKDIKGYEGLYQVSNKGRVKSLSRTVSRKRFGDYEKPESILKNQKHSGGYMKVSLCADNKITNKFVHRLVGEAFLEKIESQDQINHKNEDKTDNNTGNLEWCDGFYNNNYGTKTERQKDSEYLKGKMKAVRGVNIKTGETLIFESVKSTETKGFKRRGVRNCLNGENKQHHGYRWEYI